MFHCKFFFKEQLSKIYILVLSLPNKHTNISDKNKGNLAGAQLPKT